MNIENSAYKAAVAAAIAAGRHVLKYWPNGLNQMFDKNKALQIFANKDGVGNYATIADIESEKIILQTIQNNPDLKNHQIVAEESGGISTDSEYQWLIDPIDGTILFKNGGTEFGISIGVFKDGKPIIGVIAFPSEQTLLVSQKEKGAKLLSFEGKEILAIQKAADEPVPDDRLFIGADTGYAKRKEMYAVIGNISDKVNYMVTYASAVFSAYRLVTGSLHGYIHSSITPYDIGAAASIISECGGVITDIHGGPFDWSKKESSLLMARTPALHRQILCLLNA